MTRARKVQWADDDDETVENQKISSSNSECLKKSNSITKKLVQVRNYSGYAESHADEKIVESSPVQRKTRKFDRNLSTVHEEEDDVNESSDENV